MAIIKKEDLLKYGQKPQIVGDKKTLSKEIVDNDKATPKQFVKKEPIEELVDDDGSFIEGGTSNSSANSEIKTAPQQTTDDYASGAIQPNNYYYGLYGASYSKGSRQVTAENTQLAIEKIKKILKENKG